MKEQIRLASCNEGRWPLGAVPGSVAGCFVCFTRGQTGKGSAGEPGWASAVLLRGRKLIGSAIAHGQAAAGYEPGLLALREGPLLESALRSLPEDPDLLIVNATGLDHPRAAGLAVQLGERLAVPSIGVTERALLGEGIEPPASSGTSCPLFLNGRVVGYRLRTRAGVAPVVVHAGWQVGPEAALEIVATTTAGYRTPEPIRLARRLARDARAGKPAGHRGDRRLSWRWGR